MRFWPSVGRLACSLLTALTFYTVRVRKRSLILRKKVSLKWHLSSIFLVPSAELRLPLKNIEDVETQIRQHRRPPFCKR